MALFSKNKPLVGLDIGSSSLKAVELTKSKKGYQLTSLAYEPLAPDYVVDGAIMDAPGVADTIKKSFLAAKFKPKGVATGVSGHSVIVKRVVVPAATPDEVETAIQMDAEQYIPFEITEVNLDYQVVGPGTTSSEEAGMEVVMVAAKKDKIQNHTSVITLAGKTPEIVLEELLPRIVGCTTCEIDQMGFEQRASRGVNCARDRRNTSGMFVQ